MGLRATTFFILKITLWRAIEKKSNFVLSKYEKNKQCENK